MGPVFSFCPVLTVKSSWTESRDTEDWYLASTYSSKSNGSPFNAQQSDCNPLIDFPLTLHDYFINFLSSPKLLSVGASLQDGP